MAERLPTSENIDFSENQKRFHEVFGGRKTRWFPRSYYTREAYETRKYMIAIATEARTRKEKGTYGEISEKTGISSALLSSGSHGKLGDKPKPEYGGKSAKEYVLETLKNYYQEEYSPKPEYYI